MLTNGSGRKRREIRTVRAARIENKLAIFGNIAPPSYFLSHSRISRTSATGQAHQRIADQLSTNFQLRDIWPASFRIKYRSGIGTSLTMSTV